MFLALSIVVLLAGGSTVALPGGQIELPKGCSGPAKIRMVIDAFGGQITCRNGLSIRLFGGTLAGPACEIAQVSGDALRLQSRSGAPLVVCTYEEESEASQESKTMIVDLGVGSLTADIRTTQDAVVLLQVATGFRRLKE